MCNAPCDEHTIVHSLINRVHVGDLDTGRRMIFLAIQIHEHAAVFNRPHPPPYPLDHRNTVTSVNIDIYIRLRCAHVRLYCCPLATACQRLSNERGRGGRGGSSPAGGRLTVATKV